MRENELAFCRRGQCSVCGPESRANFAHDQCYKTARRLYRGFCLDTLMQLTRLTRPILPWACLPVTMDRVFQTPTMLSSYTDQRSPTDLGRLIATVEERLPIELQQMIFNDTPTMFQSLARCSQLVQTYSAVLRLGAPAALSTPLQYIRPLRTTLGIRQLGINVMDILGEPCIMKIGVQHPIGWQYEIEVSDRPVFGLQVALGSYGPVALRVLYTDGSMSSWLGEVYSARWFRTCPGFLENMQTAIDVCIAITPTLRRQSQILY